MQRYRNYAVKSILVFCGALCLLFALLFPHPSIEDLSFVSGLVADVQRPVKRRHSFLLKIANDSKPSLEFAVPTSNSQAGWERIGKLIGRIDRTRPIDVWYLDHWFLGFAPEIWHLEQGGKVIMNFDTKEYEYRLVRNSLAAIGCVLLLSSILVFMRRSKSRLRIE